MNKKTWKPIPPLFRRNKKKVYEKVIAAYGLVYQIGESNLLRKPSKPVLLKEIKKKEFQEKISYLKKVLIKYRKLTGMGRGVTAVQIGIPERFSVIYTGKALRSKTSRIRSKDLIVIINPKITKQSTKLYKYPEICMSANPIIAPVVRPAWIEFEYYDENGDKKYWNRKDINKEGKICNRVFQHEIDHMDGIINIDRVNSRELILESDPKFYKNAAFEEVV